MSRERHLWLVFLSAASFGVMAYFAKLATAELGGAEVATMRFVVMLAPIALLPPLWRKMIVAQRLDLLLIRGFFGGVAVLLYFLAIEHIPVGVATLLNYTSPVWSVGFAALFLDEPVDRKLVLPLAAALAGVVLVSHGRAAAGEWFHFGRWEAVGVVSAICSGVAIAAIRAARRTEGSWAIYASFSIFGLVAAVPFALPSWRAPSVVGWLLLLGVGGMSIVAQLLLTYTYKWVTNLEAGVFAPVAVLVAMGLETAFLGERPAPATLAGTLLTILGIAGLMRAQASARRRVTVP